MVGNGGYVKWQCATGEVPYVAKGDEGGLKDSTLYEAMHAAYVSGKPLFIGPFTGWGREYQAGFYDVHRDVTEGEESLYCTINSSPFDPSFPNDDTAIVRLHATENLIWITEFNV